MIDCVWVCVSRKCSARGSDLKAAARAEAVLEAETNNYRNID